MCRRRGIWILGLLLVLATCGDNSSLSTAGEPEAAPAEAVEIDPVEPEPARVVTAAREVPTVEPLVEPQPPVPSAGMALT